MRTPSPRLCVYYTLYTYTRRKGETPDGQYFSKHGNASLYVSVNYVVRVQTARIINNNVQYIICGRVARTIRSTRRRVYIFTINNNIAVRAVMYYFKDTARDCLLFVYHYKSYKSCLFNPSRRTLHDDDDDDVSCIIELYVIRQKQIYHTV